MKKKPEYDPAEKFGNLTKKEEVDAVLAAMKMLKRK